MWPRTHLTDLLGIKHPIIQAPMAGSTTVELVAAVSNAGGIGSMGYAETPIETIREDAEKIRKLTDKPFNLNFFAHDTPANKPDAIETTRKRLRPFYAQAGLSEIPRDVSKPLLTFTEEKLELLLDIKPPLVSFHFGLPEPSAIE